MKLKNNQKWHSFYNHTNDLVYEQAGHKIFNEVWIHVYDEGFEFVDDKILFQICDHIDKIL